MNIPIWLTFVLSWLGLTWSVYRLFNITSEVVTEDVKIKLTKWLTNIKIETNNNWSFYFIELFDSVFTKNHFSKDCFSRSIIASLVGYIIIYLFLISININSVAFNFSEIFGFVGVGILINTIPDYFSLLQTRYFLNFIKNKNNVLITLMFILVDIIVTTLIFVIFLFAFIQIGFFIASIIKGGDDLFSLEIWLMAQEQIFNPEQGRHIFIMSVRAGILSTFFTSLWLWMFLIASLIIKMISKTGDIVTFYQGVLNLKEKPIKVLGFCIISIITLIYLIWGITLLF